MVLDFSKCWELFVLKFDDGREDLIHTASRAYLKDRITRYENEGRKFAVYVRRGKMSIKIGSNM